MAAVGDLIDGRYRLTSYIGGGSSGNVYAATDESLVERHRVALKILSAKTVDDANRTSLELEFGLLARLRHPNIVSALSFGQTSEGATYLVEELISGPTLQQACDTIDAFDYFEIAHGILEGLAQVHRRGWVHHDIKPSNILLEELPPGSRQRWRPKIADLGVASMRGTEPGNHVNGTVPFMSPERLAGEPANPRSDIWAVGMSLLFCLTGSLPVHTSSPTRASELLDRLLLPPLRDLRPDAPPGLEAVLARMLAREKRTRYSDAAEALTDLRRELVKSKVFVPELPSTAMIHTPGFVGRENEMVEIFEHLSNQGRPRRVTIRADRGSGGTRLLNEIALESQLVGSRSVFVEVGHGVAPWRRALAQLGKTVSSHRVEEVVAAIASAFAERPSIILIDNFDTRDSATQQIVEQCASLTFPKAHIAGIVVTVPEGSVVEGMEVELQPLDREELAQITESAIGDAIETKTMTVLVSAARGNPGRLMRAIHCSVSSGALRRVAGIWELDADMVTLPVDEIVTTQSIEGLAHAARRLLTALAILGPNGAAIDLELGRGVTQYSQERLTNAIVDLQERGLVEVVQSPGDEPLRIRIGGHVAVAALGTVTAAVRRAIHHRAWKFYQQDPQTDPSILARHAWGAGSVDEALELTHSASMTALAEQNFSTVLVLTQRFADLESTLDQSLFFEILLIRAEALIHISRPRDGLSITQRVHERQPRSRRAASLLVRAAVVAEDYHAANEHLRKLELDGLQPASASERLEQTVLQVEVARLAGAVKNVETKASKAFAVIDRALKAESAPSAATRRELQRARARVLTALGAAQIFGREQREGTVNLQAALKLFKELSDTSHVAEVSAFLAAAADISGDTTMRALHITNGLEAAQRAGALGAAARLLNVRGIGHLWKGRNRDAIETLSEAESRAANAGLDRLSSAVVGNLIIVHRRSAFYQPALEAALKSLRLKRELGDDVGKAATLINIADIYRDIGLLKLSAAAAQRALRQAVHCGARSLELSARIALSIARASSGDSRGAQSSLGPVRDQIVNLHLELEQALAIGLIDVAAGRPREASVRFLQLEKLADERDQPYIAAAAALQRGIQLRSLGRPEIHRAIENATACQGAPPSVDGAGKPGTHPCRQRTTRDCWHRALSGWRGLGGGAL